jgi:hypothetical protein
MIGLGRSKEQKELKESDNNKKRRDWRRVSDLKSASYVAHRNRNTWNR